MSDPVNNNLTQKINDNNKIKMVTYKNRSYLESTNSNCALVMLDWTSFWPRFDIVVLGMDFFLFPFIYFPYSIWTFISLFYLDFYIYFLFGLLFPFSIRTFISLFNLDFYFPFQFGLFQFFFNFFFNSFFSFDRGHILEVWPII